MIREKHGEQLFTHTAESMLSWKKHPYTYTDVATESISKVVNKKDRITEQTILDVIPYVKEILSNSILASVERIEHTGNKSTVLYGYRLYNLYWVKENNKKTPHCLVCTVVQNTEQAEGYVFRDIENVTIDRGLPGENTDMPASVNDDTYTISQLYRFVKRVISSVKKYQKSFDVKIIGASSLVSPVLIMATILLLCPFYVVLLRNAPGVTIPQIIVLVIIWLVLGIVRTPIFDTYNIRYRFWSRLLPKKLLSYIVLGFYYSSFFIALIILFYFPNWVVVSLLGVYLGIVQPPIPSKYGSSRYRFLPSYDQLYEIYIDKADFWEERIAKRNENKSKK